MDEHVFCLKARIDDVKHQSCKPFTVFLSFRGAFGTLARNVIIRSMEEIQLLQLFTDIVSYIPKLLHPSNLP